MNFEGKILKAILVSSVQKKKKAKTFPESIDNLVYFYKIKLVLP